MYVYMVGVRPLFPIKNWGRAFRSMKWVLDSLNHVDDTGTESFFFSFV